MFNQHVYMYIYHNDLIDMCKQENANDIKHYDLAQARSLFLFTHYTLHIMTVRCVRQLKTFCQISIFCEQPVNQYPLAHM